MGQIRAGADAEGMVKDSRDGERLNGWSRAQQVDKDTGGQSISGNQEDKNDVSWIVRYLFAIQLTQTSIPKYCHIISIAGK